MTETNAERLARIAEENDDKVIRSSEYTYAGDEIITDIDDDFDWLVEQVAKLKKSQQAWEETARNYLDEVLRLREATKLKDKVLSFYAAAPTYEIQPDGKGGMYVDIEEDKGYRARMHLGRENLANGKNKDTTGN